ncbi:MAG: site-2 protease family protein [Anaerolineales bacterium]|nr:site-2 protease family protein [Anaerolineales bacterium]MCX7755382.1 site-2 protease family protein [Anaerolineales bacterium]MDW8278570.1 site-2 protease family protein [Anaerolineales bacterium]
MSLPAPEIFTSLVSRVFRIEDVTAGDQEYLYRFRGQLFVDSLQAHRDLSEWLQPYGLTPLFRKDRDGRQVIFLVRSLPAPQKSNAGLNVVLFVLTLASVMWVGSQFTDPALLPPDASLWEAFWIALLNSGLPFAASLLGILLAHEFGHYLAARFHNTNATLPYFIPMPVTILGTLGAVIVWKELPRNKRVLFDVGVAGPLAGLVVAVPVLLYGLSISKLGTVEPAPGGFIEGNSILYLLAKFIVFGRFLPEPASYEGLSPVLYWLRYFFTGTPAPYGGVDVFISPVALAGWAGILVTALNLLPVGQLDGGHILYTLFGHKLRYAFPVVLLFMGMMGLFWSGWWLWVVLLFLFGRRSAEPLDQITELDPPRRALAWGMVFLFFLVFTPVPMVPLG